MVGVVVPGEEDGGVGKFLEFLRQGFVKLSRIAARQVGAAAAADEERVSGDEIVLNKKALRTRRVARRVEERQLDLADRNPVAAGDFADVLFGEGAEQLSHELFPQRL